MVKSWDSEDVTVEIDGVAYDDFTGQVYLIETADEATHVIGGKVWRSTKVDHTGNIVVLGTSTAVSIIEAKMQRDGNLRNVSITFKFNEGVPYKAIQYPDCRIKRFGPDGFDVDGIPTYTGEWECAGVPTYTRKT